MTFNKYFDKALDEAAIWLDQSAQKTDRRNARRRFDSAIDKLTINGRPLTALERIHVHMILVELARREEQ